jgi:site-specific DNA recombinase
MSATPRVAIYARISEDPSGEAVGVSRQLEDARTMAAARDWQVVAEYSDNDISALGGRQRPGYDALMADVAGGRLDKVIVFHTSRLWRNRRERAAGIELLAAQAVSVAAVRGPELDLSSAYGRGMAGLMGEFDTMESEVKSERIRAAKAKTAREGRPSSRVSYGWRRVAMDGGRRTQDVIDAPAAAVVRAIVSRLLAGDTMLAIVADLNARQVPTPTAHLRALRWDRDGWCQWPRPATSAWTMATVRGLAIRDANAAIRVHHAGRPTEQTFEATWEPLVTLEDHLAVKALLPGSGVSPVGRRGDRQYLLTGGAAYCGDCGGTMRTKTGASDKGKRRYLCEGCGNIGRLIAPVDALAADVVRARILSGELSSLLEAPAADDAPRRERVAELQQRLADAATSFSAGRITIDQLEAISATLRPELDALQRDAPSAPAIPAGLAADIRQANTAAAVAELWNGWTVQQRRTAIDALGLRLTINRASKKGPRFNPNDIAITWDR